MTIYDNTMKWRGQEFFHVSQGTDCSKALPLGYTVDQPYGDQEIAMLLTESV